MDFFTIDRIEKMKALAQDGRPFVFDDGDIRSLHFSEHEIQSAMRLSAPDELVIRYTRAMAGFLLFNSALRNILVIGLGGGSIAKYCYRELPLARITVLESNGDVIALRDQFMIPPDNARFQVLHVDAAQHLTEMAEASMDAILLDGFDIDGAPEALCSFSFFNNCERVLHDQGVLVANMADDGVAITETLKQLMLLFGGRRLWWLKTQTDNSHLAFAVKDSRGMFADAAWFASVVRMCEQLSVELIHPKRPY